MFVTIYIKTSWLRSELKLEISFCWTDAASTSSSVGPIRSRSSDFDVFVLNFNNTLTDVSSVWETKKSEGNNTVTLQAQGDLFFTIQQREMIRNSFMLHQFYIQIHINTRASFESRIKNWIKPSSTNNLHWPLNDWQHVHLTRFLPAVKKKPLRRVWTPKQCMLGSLLTCRSCFLRHYKELIDLCTFIHLMSARNTSSVTRLCL